MIPAEAIAQPTHAGRPLATGKHRRGAKEAVVDCAEQSRGGVARHTLECRLVARAARACARRCARLADSSAQPLRRGTSARRQCRLRQGDIAARDPVRWCRSGAAPVERTSVGLALLDQRAEGDAAGARSGSAEHKPLFEVLRHGVGVHDGFARASGIFGQPKARRRFEREYPAAHFHFVRVDGV